MVTVAHVMSVHRTGWFEHMVHGFVDCDVPVVAGIPVSAQMAARSHGRGALGRLNGRATDNTSAGPQSPETGAPIAMSAIGCEHANNGLYPLTELYCRG